MISILIYNNLNDKIIIVMKKILEYEKTNLKLIEAFKKITSDGKKITVPNLCKEANIHEQTFYKHFPSKDLFIEYAVKLKLENFYETNKNLSLHDFFSLVLETCYKEKTHPTSRIEDYFVKGIIYIELEKLIKKKLVLASIIDDDSTIDFLTGGILFYISKAIKEVNTDNAFLYTQQKLDILITKIIAKS